VNTRFNLSQEMQAVHTEHFEPDVPVTDGQAEVGKPGMHLGRLDLSQIADANPLMGPRPEAFQSRHIRQRRDRLDGASPEAGFVHRGGCEAGIRREHEPVRDSPHRSRQNLRQRGSGDGACNDPA